MTAMASPEGADGLAPEDLRDRWPALSPEERVEGFRALHREDAGEFFLGLPARDQAAIYLGSPAGERRLWARLPDPDDAADLAGALPPAEREGLLALLDERARDEVGALLAYAEDEAGGLMSPRFVRLRPDMRADEAIRYVRLQAAERPETLRYAYVLDAGRRLVGVVTLRQLFVAPEAGAVRDLMRVDVVAVREDLGDEQVARVMARHKLSALPVVDAEGRVKGLVTADDVMAVVERAATEDVHKLGGVRPLGASYLGMRLGAVWRKRAGWLAALFVGEALTAASLGRGGAGAGRAAAVALFVPLVLSGGGNAGAQAAAVVVRAMALGEVRPRDWRRVLRRELASGLALGSALAAFGLARVLAWQALFHPYGAHAPRLALAVAAGVGGAVLWGSVAGAMLPFALRRAGLDPADASAPLVATLVDVAGLAFYLDVARALLGAAPP